MFKSTGAVALETGHIIDALDQASLGKVKQVMGTKDGRTYGYFGGKRLDSAYQPIYSLPHRRIVGHEGLLRATNFEGKNIPPIQVFNGDGGSISDAQLVFLDRLCRTIHLHNYQAVQSNNQWLFLNVSAQVINHRRDHGPFFAELLESYGVSPQQVVVEIVEGVIPDVRLLNEAVKFYRDAGCLIAIDDFGADASDIERIWRVSPDIVKLDRKMIAAAESNDKARSVLRATVGLIHEAGSLALLEGVENREQAIIALESNADLVQGFYFAMPTPEPLQHGDGGISELAAMKPSGAMDELLPCMMEFRCALLHLAANQSAKMACNTLLSMEKVDCCYVIDAYGKQLGARLSAKSEVKESLFMPLQDTLGADWSRKPYFYRAIFQPEELQISRPYLSVSSGRLCITLSSTFLIGGQQRVLCCDLAWRDEM